MGHYIPNLGRILLSWILSVCVLGSFWAFLMLILEPSHDELTTLPIWHWSTPFLLSLMAPAVVNMWQLFHRGSDVVRELSLLAFFIGRSLQRVATSIDPSSMVRRSRRGLFRGLAGLGELAFRAGARLAHSAANLDPPGRMRRPRDHTLAVYVEFCEMIIEEAHKQAAPRPAREDHAESVGARRRGAPPLEERADAADKRKKAEKYLQRVEKGMTKETAAQLAGHSRKTLETWVKRLL